VYAERDDGLDDRSHRQVSLHIAHELPIDLDLVEADARKIAAAWEGNGVSGVLNKPCGAGATAKPKYRGKAGSEKAMV
jgi:hypothetical protein